MVKLNTHSPTYCMKIIDRIDQILDTHSRQKYLTSILAFQYLQVCMHSDDNEVMLYANNRLRPSGHNVLDYLSTS